MSFSSNLFPLCQMIQIMRVIFQGGVPEKTFQRNEKTKQQTFGAAQKTAPEKIQPQKDGKPRCQTAQHAACFACLRAFGSAQLHVLRQLVEAAVN